MKLRTTGVVAVALASCWGGLALAAPAATAAEPAPVAAAPATGTTVTRYKGQTVTIDTSSGSPVLTITRGHNVTTVPVTVSGQYMFARAADGVVHVWFFQSGAIAEWTYDLNQRSQATILHTGVFSWYGPAGFWATETAPDGTLTDVMYNWLGQELYRLPDTLRANTSWFTTTAGYVRVEGANPTGVAVVPVNGDPVKVWELGLPVVSVGFPSNTAAEVTYLDASGQRLTCELSETGSTCPGGWANA